MVGNTQPMGATPLEVGSVPRGQAPSPHNAYLKGFVALASADAVASARFIADAVDPQLDLRAVVHCLAASHLTSHRLDTCGEPGLMALCGLRRPPALR